jgi:hypothetical protein
MCLSLKTGCSRVRLLNSSVIFLKHRNTKPCRSAGLCYLHFLLTLIFLTFAARNGKNWTYRTAGHAVVVSTYGGC